MTSNNGHSPNGRINFAKRKTARVPIEELGETIILRALSVSQVESIKDDPDRAIKHLVHAIVNESGEQIYQDTPEDIANLKEMSVPTFMKLVETLNDLETTTPQAQEEIKKN